MRQANVQHLDEPVVHIFVIAGDLEDNILSKRVLIPDFVLDGSNRREIRISKYIPSRKARSLFDTILIFV